MYVNNYGKVLVYEYTIITVLYTYIGAHTPHAFADTKTVIVKIIENLSH